MRQLLPVPPARAPGIRAGSGRAGAGAGQGAGAARSWRAHAPGGGRPTAGRHALKREKGPAIRVIAGTARGRSLHSPAGRGTRPTSDRLKQALFNILGEAVPDADVLDLFAGSGALGIEALSRGARSAIFVERDARAARVVERNLARCGFGAAAPGAARVIVADVRAACHRLLRAGLASGPDAAAPPSSGDGGPIPHLALPARAGRPRTSPPPASGAGSRRGPDAHPCLPGAAVAAPAGYAAAAGRDGAGHPAPGASGTPGARPPDGAPPPFTLVLADPPYATGEAARTLAMLAGELAPLLHPCALVAIEHVHGEEMPERAGNLRLMRRRVQGHGCVSVYGAGRPGAEVNSGAASRL